MFDKYYTKLSFKSQVKLYLATGSTEDTEIFRFFVGWRLWPTVHATKDSKDHEETIRKKVPDTLTPDTLTPSRRNNTHLDTPDTFNLCVHHRPHHAKAGRADLSQKSPGLAGEGVPPLSLAGV